MCMQHLFSSVEGNGGPLVVGAIKSIGVKLRTSILGVKGELVAAYSGYDH